MAATHNHLFPSECSTPRKVVVRSRPRIPFFSSLIRAGFPSPATDYVERVCDLNDLLVNRPEATYFGRVDGDSMIGEHILPGSILIVDSSEEAKTGQIVVAWYNGGHTVKYIQFVGEMVVLHSANPAYLPIYVHPGDDFRIFGVVTSIIIKPAFKPSFDQPD